MEDPTRFELKAALLQWGEELAGQPGLTPETRKELEAHLRDTVEELRRRGLNEEESFWLACRRTGPPREMGEEFAKADGGAVWRQSVLWIAVAFLANQIAQGLCAELSVPMRFVQLHTAQWWVEGLAEGFRSAWVCEFVGTVTVVWVAAVIAWSPNETAARLWRFFFQSRTRFVVIGALTVLTIFALPYAGSGLSGGAFVSDVDSSYGLVSQIVSQSAYSKLVFQMALVILVAWLMPSNRAVKRPGASGWLSRLTRA